MKINEKIADTTFSILQSIMLGSDTNASMSVRLYGGEERARVMQGDFVSDQIVLYYRRSINDELISMNIQKDGRKESIAFLKTFLSFGKEDLRCYILSDRERIPFKTITLKSLKIMLQRTCILSPGDGIIDVREIEADMEYLASNLSTQIGAGDAST